MKMRKVFLLTMLTSLFFVGCSDDDEVKGKFDGKPVRFNSEIQGQTRASGTQWDQEDAIGIYMKTSGVVLSATSAQAENKKHTTVGNQGEFVYATPEDAIYFPADGSNVDFIAYYPYQQTITDFKYPVNVGGNQTGALPDIDLMYSNNETGKNNSAANVSLQFVHKLAIVSWTVTDEGGKSLAGMKVTITGMKTKSSFSLADATFTDDASSFANIIAETEANNSWATSQAIVLPVNGLSGAKVLFEVPSHGKTYEWDIPVGQEYKSGNKYSYEVEIKAEGGLVVLNPSSDITDWVDNDGGKIELGENEEPSGDGTQASPYVLSQLGDKIGETDKWVEGYIVGSTVKPRAIGTPSADNILIAATAAETDEANCIPVDISSSPVKDNLNIVANPSLIGKKIKIQGNIVDDIFGGSLSMTNITAQVGGVDPGPGPGGEPEEFFMETFGTGDYPSANRPKIAAFTDFDMKEPVVYSDQYGNADVRSTNTMNAAVWFPASKEAELHIEGFTSGYSSVKLKFDMAAQVAETNANLIQIKANGTLLSTQPDYHFSATNTYATIELDIPDGTTSITFYGAADVNTKAFRVDNITLTGTK